MKHYDLVVVPELYTALLVDLNRGTGIGMVEIPDRRKGRPDRHRP
jgi:hypothetical protein